MTDTERKSFVEPVDGVDDADLDQAVGGGTATTTTTTSGSTVSTSEIVVTKHTDTTSPKLF